MSLNNQLPTITNSDYVTHSTATPRDDQLDDLHAYTPLLHDAAAHDDAAGADHSSSEPGSSFLQTTFNCVSLLLGLGMLASPYAVQKAGWCIFFMGLVGIPVVYFYCALLLKRCLEKHTDLRSYEDISEKAYGKAGLKLFTIIFYLEVYATLVSYGVSIGDNLVQILVDEMGGNADGLWQNRWFLTALALLVVLPTAWLRNLRALSVMSACSVVSAAVVILSVVWLAVTHEVTFSDSPLVAVHPVWLPVSTSIYLFCYSGHVVLPGIYLSMEDKSKFTKAITLSFSISTVCYAGLGLLGALMFGDDIQSQVTLNLPSEFLASKVALWLSVIVPITKFALMLSPLSTAAERYLPWPKATKKHALASIITRSCLALSVFLVALIFPFFSYVLALMGATVCVTLCVIFPCLFYLQIMGSSLSKLQRSTCIGLVMLGSIVGVTCTGFSIRNYVVDDTIIT